MSKSNLTKRALAQALKEQMITRPFQKISVGDICAACGMNRKSFYYHFSDKYDLLSWIFSDEYLEQLDVTQFESGWELFEDMCLYFYRERDFYRPAFQVSGQNSFSSYLGSVMKPVIDQVMERLYPAALQLKTWGILLTFFTDIAFPSFFSWLTQQEDLNIEEFLETNRKTILDLAEILFRRKKDE